MTLNFLKTLTFLMFFALVSVAYKSNDSVANFVSSQNQNSFFCKISGREYKPQFVSGIHETMSNVILITGAAGSNSEQVQIQVSHAIEPGTYADLNNIGANTFVWMFYAPPFSEDATDDGFAQKGSLTIIENNSTTKRIRGTFSFLTGPSINAGTIWDITEGSFDVRYQ